MEQKVQERTLELAGSVEQLEEEMKERVQLEIALREREALYRAVVEDQTEFIARSSPDLVDTFVNDALCQHLGRAREELIGKNWLESLSEDNRKATLAHFASLTPENPIATIERELIAPDGTRRWEQWTNRVLFDEHGQLLEYQGVGRDITERVRAEEQIKAALAKKEVLLRELYHRTKNNMQVISSMLALQSSHAQDEQVLKIMRDTENRINSMSLVHQKLYQSKDLSSINLKEYISELANLLLESYRVSPHRISLVLDIDNISTLIDTAIPCGLVLNELISNSLKHAFPNDMKGEIRIRLKKRGEEIELRISDNGVGVPQGFDFQKSETLGFQIIIMIAEHQLQGKVEFETQDGISCQIRFQDTLNQQRV